MGHNLLQIMFLDRQDNRKEVEQAYRKELKAEVDNKRSRVFSNKNSQQYRPEKESFSLIANIQREQNERKKKNQMYYDDLRNQMEQNRREKQQKQEEKKQRQLQEENKIKEQQRRLQERYEEELRKENKGKKNAVSEARTEPPPPQQTFKRKRELSMSRQLPELPKKEQSQNEARITRQKSLSYQAPEVNLRTYQSNIQSYTPPAPTLYSNKIQNETFNYVSRNVYKDSYYKQLLGQRRKLEEEANQISELNRIFNAERYKRRQESKGLQQLRNLQKMLDSKNAEYLDVNFTEGRPSITQSGKLRPLNKIQKTGIFAPRVNKDQWRKLD